MKHCETRQTCPELGVLQFAFDNNPDNPHRPYNYPFDSVVYTGTHDNDTTAGWLNTLSGPDRARVDGGHIGSSKPAVVDDLVRLAFSTTADLCIIPLQDVLGLDSRARMNTPGRSEGNWQWRCAKADFTRQKLERVAEFAAIYGRSRPENGNSGQHRTRKGFSLEHSHISIVGAGVVGLAIASRLSADHKDILLLEKHDGFGRKTSSRNR